jgi:hypothetical protein
MNKSYSSKLHQLRWRVLTLMILSSVLDPDPHGSALIWLSWNLIRVLTNKPDFQPFKLDFCNYVPVGMFYDILSTKSIFSGQNLSLCKGKVLPGFESALVWLPGSGSGPALQKLFVKIYRTKCRKVMRMLTFPYVWCRKGKICQEQMKQRDHFGIFSQNMAFVCRSVVTVPYWSTRWFVPSFCF